MILPENASNIILADILSTITLFWMCCYVIGYSYKLHDNALFIGVSVSSWILIALWYWNTNNIERGLALAFFFICMMAFRIIHEQRNELTKKSEDGQKIRKAMSTSGSSNVNVQDSETFKDSNK